MKYNELASFRSWLEGSASAGPAVAPSTAQTYSNCMDYLLKDQYIMSCKDMDVNKIMEQLREMTHKNQYSKHKNAFLKFCDFQNIKLDKETKAELDTMMDSKKKKRRKPKPVTLTSIENHIRVIRDKKLKLSFETLLFSGLRVSELAQIKKDDCIIFNDKIELSFMGKGQNIESVQILKEDNERVFKNLTEKINASHENEKLFYSASYLQEQAKKKGFQCHDLRRAYSKTSYKKYKDINKVQELMRHAKKKNTKIYLRSKVDID